MKIVFLCACLEPGKDGVGDYTRRLATALIRQGHSVAAVALNDKHITENLNNNQQSELTELPVLRLPGTWVMKDRFTYAKQYIDNFDPDWVSAQFVIFGFHRKGLPWGLSRQIATLGVNRKWHIMFHELWLGMDAGASKKHLLWGSLQRFLIKQLIKNLNPEIIHTNTKLYKYHIGRLGFKAELLPLFGNISQNSSEGKDLAPPPGVDQSIKLILFGHIHPNTPFAEFAAEISAYQAEHKKKVLLTIIGRCGSEQEKWVDSWVANGLTVNVLGEQSPSYISTTLATCSMGIATTPFSLIGKSGAVAAMHEHGLTVICVPGPWQPKDFNDEEETKGVVVYNKGNLESIFINKLSAPVSNSVSLVTQQFIKALLNAD